MRDAGFDLTSVTQQARAPSQSEVNISQDVPSNWVSCRINCIMLFTDIWKN